MMFAAAAGFSMDRAARGRVLPESTVGAVPEAQGTTVAYACPMISMLGSHRVIGASLGLALSFVTGCGSDTFDVTLKSRQPIALGAASKARLTLWGYDATIADVGATRLDDETVSVGQLPATVAMHFPDDAEHRVGPNNGAKSRICYYVGLVVDVDGDGQICEGDLRVDFDVSKIEETCSVDAMAKDFVVRKVPAGEGCQPVTAY